MASSACRCSRSSLRPGPPLPASAISLAAASLGVLTALQQRRQSGPGCRHAPGRAAALSSFVDRRLAVGQSADAARTIMMLRNFAGRPLRSLAHHRRHRLRRADGRARPVLAGRHRPHDRGPVQSGRTRQRRWSLSRIRSTAPSSATSPASPACSPSKGSASSRFACARGIAAYLTSVIGLPTAANCAARTTPPCVPIEVPPEGHHAHAPACRAARRGSRRHHDDRGHGGAAPQARFAGQRQSSTRRSGWRPTWRSIRSTSLTGEGAVVSAADLYRRAARRFRPCRDASRNCPSSSRWR